MRPHRGAMFIGLALVIANGFSSGQFNRIWNIVISGPTHIVFGGQPGNATVNTMPKEKGDFLVILGELLFLAVLSEIASSSDTAESAVLALFVGLWLVWLMKNGSFVSRFASAITPNNSK